MCAYIWFPRAAESRKRLSEGVVPECMNIGSPYNDKRQVVLSVENLFGRIQNV